MIDGAFRAVLVTRGRVTGRPHGVELLAVGYGGKAYFSRHRPDGDWFQNALADPEVTVRYQNWTFTGRAGLVTDEALAARISELKYPGKEKARERRVVIEVTPDSTR